MNFLKKKLETFFKIILVSLFFFILIDFLFGNLILKIINKDEKKPYINHKIYHHSLKKNFNDIAQWDVEYRYCTDSNGFKSSCNTISTKTFDLAFIGDSFTEGVGLPYEKTFVGIIANSNKKSIKIKKNSDTKIILKKVSNFFLKKSINIVN